MHDSQFLKHQEKEEPNEKQLNAIRKNNSLALNPVIQQLFKQGQGDKIIKLAYQDKDYPKLLPQGYSIYLDYQIRGQ